MIDNPPQLITTKRAAALLHVNQQTIVDWLNKGQIRGVRLPGGQYRVDAAAVGELLAQATAASADVQSTVPNRKPGPTN
jgi:excisionase family DNA binding protein